MRRSGRAVGEQGRVGAHNRERKRAERLRCELAEVAQTDGAHHLSVFPRGIADAHCVESPAEHRLERLKRRAVAEHAQDIFRNQAKLLESGAAEVPGCARLNLVEGPAGEVRLGKDVADVDLAVGVHVKHGNAVADARACAVG